jgi:hypothetical protein
MNSLETTRLFTIAGFLALLIIPAAGQTSYCAFEVRVTGPAGAPVANVPVYLIRNQRTTLSDTITNAKGVARICDSPLGAVDIAVGFDVCGSVLVKDIKATWPTTRPVLVTYVETSCDHFVFGDYCQILLRIHDEDGQPVAAARFQGRSSSVSGSDVSDNFGRIFRSIKTGEKLEGVITKDGRDPARISEQCLPHGERDMELKIMLRKR